MNAPNNPRKVCKLLHALLHHSSFPPINGLPSATTDQVHPRIRARSRPHRVCATVSLPTPPITDSSSSSSGPKTPPKRQRRAMNSSKESQSVSKVQIDTTDIYRSGFPNPLPDLPLSSRPIDLAAAEKFEQLRDKINDAKGMAGIDIYELSFLKQGVYDEEPSPNDNTVVVRTTKDPERDNLTIAADRILGVLYAAGVTDWRVEIYDPRANRKFFLPKVTWNWASTVWPELRNDFVDILGPGNKEWSSVSLFNRGHAEPDSVPTVVIGTRPSASLTWKSNTCSMILDRLEQAQLNYDVVFVRESLPCVDKDDKTKKDLPLSQFSGPVTMGSSIGMENNTGTLGGYLTLEKGGEKKTFGLTNHRVVFPNEIVAQAKQLSEDGVKYCGEFTWPVFSPSPADKDATIKRLSRKIEVWEEQIEGLSLRTTNQNPGAVREKPAGGWKKMIKRQ